MTDRVDRPGEETGLVRTFVISDAHGHPALIEHALEHGGFEPGLDRFVYAGDLLDRGPDAGGCIALVEQYATEVLIGNHDLAALFGFFIFPQNADSSGYKGFLRQKVLAPQSANAWKMAACVDSVLITHAGLSVEYGRFFRGDCGCDPVRLADHLNEEFRCLVQQESWPGDWEDHHLLGEHGPFWFRPWPLSHLLPLTDCVQVAGHTPPLTYIEIPGFHMIDPGVAAGMEDPRHFRYAVIEGGKVRVEEGTGASAGTAVGSEEPAPAVRD
ncbi:MAG: hypothetical protein GXY46_09410 [Actinobacteria bacterium]|nr:hypothetical protein [Actinomycetota bacterium]